ncbi:hypothetical protein BC826DRAFT_972305 [Russula brevipes]|nr:hypothetical protein BC826DRAFT_972305 [Russula brevipes]
MDSARREIVVRMLVTTEPAVCGPTLARTREHRAANTARRKETLIHKVGITGTSVSLPPSDISSLATHIGMEGEDGAQIVDSSLQIWSICLKHADKVDRALVESWKADMDGILIFSGLFSAIVTAFLIDSYKGLQPDFGSANTNLTAQVAILLARSTNQTDPVLPPMPTPNSQTAYLTINVLWFLSLTCSLLCALAATLVQQWSRTYLQGTEERFNPHQRTRMRTYLQQGVQKFHFSELVDAIPMLLHVALFLFFTGLLVFLFNLDTTLARILLVFIVPAFFLYALLTTLPVFFYDCPYKTPLTSILSYLTYAVAAYGPRRRHRGRKPTFNRWHPDKQATHLTSLWAQDGDVQGAELDHAALRWTLFALTDPNDLELFVGALPGLLQSDSSTGVTRDGASAAQALLFGPDMLAKNIVRLLHSAVPSDALPLAATDRRRLDARAMMCLGTISLLARACDGPTQSAPQLWPAWATMYSNPIARDALAFCEDPQPALATLAQSTVLLLTWRALVTYRAFLADIRHRATTATNAPAVLSNHFKSELRSRLSAGVYLALALRDVLHGLSGDPVPGIDGGALLALRSEELLNGSLQAYMPGDVADLNLGALSQAAGADMGRAKICLAVLFMHAACLLPANAAGQEALRALATPLRWPEQCEYDEPTAAMMLLDAVHHEHGEETVLDADEVVALYSSIHDPHQPWPE